MAAGSVKFEGTGPFYLHRVEHATASALAGTIQLTLYAAVEGRSEALLKLETQMTPSAAEELASTLFRALSQAAPERCDALRMNGHQAIGKDTG
jgi:hypothetical protein